MALFVRNYWRSRSGKVKRFLLVVVSALCSEKFEILIRIRKTFSHTTVHIFSNNNIELVTSARFWFVN